MNVTEEKKDEIKKETNTAQATFLSILDRLDKLHADEIRFDLPMHGDLDFSLLKDRDFKHVASIIFEHEGEVTSIQNVPESIKKIECRKQMLTELHDLPESLEELDITGNYLQKFDANSLKSLKILRVSDNELEAMDHLPESIEEIECENNQLTKIDLAGCINLRLLHCSNNQLLVVSNPPESLTDFEMENNPFLEISKDIDPEDKAKSDKRVDYLESMNEYFALKRKYEEKKKQLKKSAYERMQGSKKGFKKTVNPPCISCKRPVGSIFDRKDGRYLATCGDKLNPCKLNIQLFSGTHFNNETLLTLYKEDLEKMKEEIIKQKMDTLFNYISEDKSVTDFKKTLDDYNSDSKMYKNLMERYKDLHENQEKALAIEKKTQEIYDILADIKGQIKEYEKTNNRKILMSALHIYKRDLMPAIKHRQMNQYEVMEVDINEDANMSKLFQKELALNKMDFKYGEEPKVVKFIRGNQGFP
jgi:hypothetical protein